MSRDTVLPTGNFLPVHYSGNPAEVTDLLVWVCTIMAVDPSELTAEFFSEMEGARIAKRQDKRTIGHYSVRKGRTMIGLDLAEAADPEGLTAIIAHELTHVRLLGENRIDRDRRDGERLTDLLTVFFGLGILTTNAALRYGGPSRGDGSTRLDCLTQREFGYAMACYAWLRGEPEPPWAVHLSPGPRAYLRQSLAFMASETVPGRLPTRRTDHGRFSLAVRPEINPSRQRPDGDRSDRPLRRGVRSA